MAETGIVRFPGSLDPRAEEFTPRIQTLYRPAQLFYPCVPTTGVQLQPLPFCNASPVGVPYPTYCSPAAYVGPLVPPAPPSPTPSSSSSSSPSSPTRSLLLCSVPAEVASESLLRRELEVFGDVRGVQMERVREGIVIVHFYDLRHAEMALMAIRKQHMQHQTRIRNNFYPTVVKSPNSALDPAAAAARGLVAGCAVWAQYIVPAYNAVPQGQNQGTIVIFNLDSEVSAESLRHIFEAFGPVRELRETPSKKYQRFVEFFDVRDAAKALNEMNGKEINGKAVVIEFSRPGGGHGRKFFNNNYHTTVSKNAMPLNFQPPPPPSPPWAHKSARRFSHLPPQSQLLSRKTAGNNKGNNNNNNNNGDVNLESLNSVSLETTMGLTSLRGVEEKQSEGPAPRNAAVKNLGGEAVAAAGSTKQQPRSRNWKGKQGKKQETRFLIKEDAIIESSCKDSRTTVMIKNIPNKYSQKLLLNMLDNHCIHCNEQIGDGDDQPLSSYDFVYLPIDFNNKCNVGYGFVNMTSPEATLRLYKAFHLQHWEVFNSRKICQVTYARVQGLEALKEHFKNSKFPCEIEHYLPVVFSPPRDGRQLTEPLPIVGQKQPGEAIDVADCKAINDDGEVEGKNRADGCDGGGGGEQRHDMQSSSSENGGGEDDDDDDDDRRGRRSEGGEEMGRD